MGMGKIEMGFVSIGFYGDRKKQQKKKNSVDGVQVITTRAGISGIFQMYD